MITKISKIRNKFRVLTLSGAIVLIYLPIFFVQIYIHDNNDFSAAIYYAEHMQIGFDKVIPTNQSHPLYQASVLAIHLLTTLDFNKSAMIIALIFEVLLGLELFHLFNTSGNINSSHKFTKWAVPVVLSLMLAAPIPGLVLIDWHLYFGYLGLANYHNPTINLLKPLAILNLLYVFKIFQTKNNINIDI